MNQTTMANRLSISQGHLSKVLSGHAAGRKTYEKIAAALANGKKWHDIAAMEPQDLDKHLNSELAADER